jgi:ribosome maturation factor RimP
MSPTASPRLDRQQLRSLLESAVGRTGAELEDVTDQRAGKRRLIRVVVDRDGGVSSDLITDVSHAVSAALDESDALGEAPYVLEVTTPGVDRPLTEPRHWRRARGRLVKAVLADGGEVLGRVQSSDEAGVTLLVADTERTLGYGEVARAKMQVEFNRAGDGADEEEDGADLDPSQDESELEAGADDEDEHDAGEDAADDDADDES